MTRVGILTLEDQIIKLKREHNAVILGHYYQEEDIQDIADFIGDSLDLSRKAANTDADIIVFCGVTFMAEVAKILNPTKQILVPDMNAGCSLEESCQPGVFARFLEKHPEHVVISYINCSAAIKAMSDIIVTSSNAEKIINQVPANKEIIFAPDKHLGKYLQKKTGRDMLLWQGSCIVHEQFSYKRLIKLKTRYQEAYVIAHPECPEILLEESDFIGSTSKLIEFVKNNKGKDFIVLTEPGIIHQMKKYSSESNFIEVPNSSQDGADCVNCNSCPYMRLNTMEKLYLTLKNKTNEILLDDKTLNKAKLPLDRMLELSETIRINEFQVQDDLGA